MAYSKGEFIQWLNADEEGAFSCIGQVISHKNGMITFTNKIGMIMSVPDDDGEFETCHKPRNWNVNKPAEPKREKTQTVTRTSRPKNGPSKKEQALTIYRDIVGNGHGKDMCIQRFMDVLNMSKAGATTYYYVCKKLEG